MNYIQQPMPNPKDISDPITAIDMAHVRMARAFQLNNTTLTNNNPRSSSNPHNRQIAQPGMNMGQDKQMLMVDDNVGNQFRKNVGLIIGNQNGYNAVHYVGNQVGQNAVQNLGDGHYARNYSVRLRKKDVAYLQTQLQNAQTEEEGIQLNPEEFDFMVAAGAYEEIEEVNANHTLEDNLQQASTSGESIQTMHMLSPKPDSFYHTEQKMAPGYQNPFYLKQAQQKQHSLYNGKVLLQKHDPPAVYDSEETLQLAQESRLKIKQLNKEIKLANYAKINQLSEVFVSQKAKSHEELYFSNTSKMASVSNTVPKPISIPNEEFLYDTSPSVAQKFINEVNAPLIQFLKEATKFVRDFKSLAKEADASLDKHKALEFQIKRLLRVVVSQDIMSIVQNNSVVDTSNHQTDIYRMKEKLETCIIKKEKEYDVLWNDWYKKCKECKYDKISYDKADNDMKNQIKRLQAQLGDLKGKSNNTQCASTTLDPLSQKLDDENVSLEF
ncbi:hypothetical protein Tco_0621686 [Tanacetum coccineum]